MFKIAETKFTYTHAQKCTENVVKNPGANHYQQSLKSEKSVKESNK